MIESYRSKGLVAAYIFGYKIKRDHFSGYSFAPSCGRCRFMIPDLFTATRYCVYRFTTPFINMVLQHLDGHKEELLPVIKAWAASSEEYTICFGLEMLMSHYLEDDFKPEYLKIAAAVRSEKYYVNMMIAWFFATALAKQ